MIETKRVLRKRIAHRELEIDNLRARIKQLEEAQPLMSIDEARKLADKLAATPDPTCRHCGGLHSHKCWRVKREIVKGTDLVEAEYWQVWDKSTTIWPEDVLAVVMSSETTKN